MNSLSRRIGLRGVAGLAALLGARRAPAQEGSYYPPLPPASMGPGLAIDGGSVTEPASDYHTRWNLFQKRSRSTERAERRRMIATRLNGGMPPGIAACHSWSPAFRSIVAARLIDAEENKVTGIFETLREQLGLR